MAKNFAVKIIKAGHWRRVEGTIPSGEDNEDRPHIIPLNERAEKFIELDRGGWQGTTGLTPGEVRKDGGKWIVAYRFRADAPIGKIEALTDELEKAFIASGVR